MFKFILPLIAINSLCCSGISNHLKKGKNDQQNSSTTTTSTPSNNANQEEQWRQNRFHSDQQNQQNEPPAATMLGLTIGYAFPLLENNNIAQASVLPESDATTGSIPKGEDHTLPSSGTPSFTLALAVKPNKAWDSASYGVEFTYFLQKSKPEGVTTDSSLTTTSTYQSSQNTYVEDIKHILADMSHKFQMIGAYFRKPLISNEFAFFDFGCGGRYLGLNAARNITYTTDSQVSCVCLSQDIKGLGIFFFESFGAFFTNRMGLEFTFEQGVLYNKFNLSHTTHTDSDAEVLQTANTGSNPTDFNPMQRIRVELAFHDWNFSEKHIEFQVGIDYLTLKADKLSKSLDTSYTNTKAIHIPSFIVTLGIYF